MALELLPDTHPLLRKAVPETDLSTMVSPTPAELAEAMLGAMHREEGAGLAANQVGLQVRCFVMRSRHEEDIAFFNPTILPATDEKRTGIESCLSFPGMSLEVDRHPVVRIVYQDADGRPCDRVFEGFDAVCVQHEVDHLDGIPFTKRVSRLALEIARRKIAKARKAERRR